MGSHNTRVIRLIGLFKLLKGILLIAVGVGAFRMIHSDITDIATRLVTKLGLDPGGRHVGRLLLETANLTPDKIRALGVGSFLYAALFLTEGTGLLMAKRWAEWFSVIITSSLVPFEMYEIYRRPTLLKFGALLVNLAFVAYLVYRIRTDDPASEESHS
ncbi:MAG TPA: DUF2127 domain-containing protein [Candidatus Sulfotelmatobacter sp.]|nr:DUF2127 domain-containing protein [Candidatus Sulfotelmatobacter sp.]